MSSTKAAPTISVLLPVHNAESYIRQSVESVLAQTFTDFEVLALDDGSTDRSLSILRGYEAQDLRVRVLSRESRGLVPTLNELITGARGRFLARMDADDICRPQRFAKQIRYLEDHPECVVVGTAVLLVDPKGMPIREFVYPSMHEEIDSGHLSGAGESRLCHPSIVMRREAVLRAGKYCERYRFAQDMDLYLRLAEVGRMANLPEVLLEYRHHLKSICYVRGGEQRKFATEAVQAARARRGFAAVVPGHGAESEPESASAVHRKWAWWALSAKNLTTARKHALTAFVTDPFSVENIRVAVCAIRGY